MLKLIIIIVLLSTGVIAENQSCTIEPKNLIKQTIYTSSSEKAKELTPYIFMILLALIAIKSILKNDNNKSNNRNCWISRRTRK